MTAPTHVQPDDDLATGRHPACADDACDPPRAATRNRFFHRKRMDVRHWRAEQDYHRRARHLLARLGLGSGVLCGLEVALSNAGTVLVSRGVAVDGRGRTVVVPHAVEIDPARLTDCCGRPGRDAVTDGTVTVSLCYHECGVDLVVLPDACADEPRCVPDMVRETFAFAVTDGATERETLPDGVCAAVFGDCAPLCPDDSYDDVDEDDGEAPYGPVDDRRTLLDRLAPRGCACAEECMPLAVVTLAAEEPPVLDTSVRTVLRSNRELLDLILCLADRVDDCCRTPTALPPRITALWPWPDDDGTALTVFRQYGRLELAFDRDMAEQGLDDPDPWLGVWLLDDKAARRLPIARSAGSLTRVTVPPGGDGAAYEVDVAPESVTDETVVVVMVRSVQPGPIRAAGPDRLALDAEMAATGLTADERRALWEIDPGDGDGGPGGLVSHVAGGPGWLPTGDGAPGGELHLALRRPTDATPPQLLTVWPEGGWYYGPNAFPEALPAWRSFLEVPRIELLVSRALDAAAVANPDLWLRLWHGTQDGPTIYGIRQIPLAPGQADPQMDGSVRYVFRLGSVDWYGRDVLIAQLRSTPPLQGGSPVGDAEPRVLLDADFTGTVLDSQMLFTLWTGTASDVPDPQPGRTDGVPLFDRVEGGLAHWAFTVQRP